MTNQRTPALLAVVMKASAQQWFVAGIEPDATVRPLVRSEPGNLDQYVGQNDDEQLSFLRHRLSGAMQRGVDRLWGLGAKAERIVMIADADLPDSPDSLLPRLADHLHTWMTKPPVSFYRGNGEASIDDYQTLQCLVEQPDHEQQECLRKALPKLSQQLNRPDEWEVIKKKPEA